MDERVFDGDNEDSDAESFLLGIWRSMANDDRQRVWGVVGPVAGTLARVPGQVTSGRAWLTPTEHPAVRNAHARSLLTALVPDSWTLALDTTTPVDADTWRERLRAALKWWQLVDFADDERLARASRQPTWRSRGWLDDELFGQRLGEPSYAQDARGMPEKDPARASLETKVVRGKRCRLFLAEDSHDSHAQAIGRRPLSQEELDAWERGTTERRRDATAIGAHLVQLIGPSPQAVHADDLPDGTTLAPNRPIAQILMRLTGLQPQAPLLYPLEALQAVARQLDPFSKSDSHWNDAGAFVGYEAVIDVVAPHVPVRRVSRASVSLHPTCYVGDLGSKLDTPQASVFWRARIDSPKARLREDNRVRNHGRRAVFTCEAAPEGTCLVFGDSWAYPMTLFLAESFRRVVFYHRVNIVDRDILLAERPSVVLSILTERFCTALPDDAHVEPFDRVVARRLAKGDVVPAAASHARHPFLFSLELERGLPPTGGIRLQ